MTFWKKNLQGQKTDQLLTGAVCGKRNCLQKFVASAKVKFQWKFVILNDYIRKRQKLKINEIKVQLQALKRNINNPKERK